jgi:UDP-N-acetylglucosamine acyltransferase
MAIDPSAQVHATAVVDDRAEIGANVVIGPFCVIGHDVTIGEGTELKAHVVVDGHTVIGKRNRIFPFASLGQEPQDLKYKGERTLLEVGDENTIREYVTMNTGTVGGGGVTRVGSGNLFMNYVHIGHDCIVGDGAIFANCATLGGHVTVGDRAVIGGLAAVHQHCRIGVGAMIGGLAGIAADVIPYGTALGERAHLSGLNLVGLKRRGAEKSDINGLRAAYGLLFEGEGTLTERAERVAASHGDNPLVAEVLAFITEGSSRHLTTPS